MANKKIYTYSEIREEYVKCMLDKTRRYMIENFLSTFDATQKKQVPFKLLPRQEILVQSLRDYDNVITIKSRQEGITTTVAAVMACEMVLAPKESPENILCIGNKLDLSQQMITKIKEFIRQLPRWFFGDDYFSLDPKDEKNNDKKNPIFTICNKNEIELSHNTSSGHARSSGENSSRGISAVSRLIFDEAAFIEKGRTVYAQALPTISTGGKITIISTPNGKDQLYYDIYDKAKAGRNNFHIVESRWHQDPRYNKYLKWFRTNEETGETEVYHEPTIDSKGNVAYKNDEWEKRLAEGWKPESPWYVNMCNSFNNDSMKIAQELDVSFLGSANNVVGAEYITFQELNNVREPLFKDQILEDFWIFKEPIDGHRYICACLPTGEKVLTDKGLMNIENVKSDNLLITKEGKYTKIKHRKYKTVNNEKIISLKTYGSVRETKFTWNHPIWASIDSTNNKKYVGKINGKRKWKYSWKHKFDYVNAEDLKINDWLEYPNLYHINEMNEFELSSKWNKYSNIGNEQYSINNPLLCEDFWWYCGMWLAEGHISTDNNNNKKIATTHNINEKEYHNKIKDIIEKLLNRSAIFTQRLSYNATEICFYSKQIAEFLFDNFGKYSYGKYISEWIKFIPKKYKSKLVEGYINGDGWIHKYGISAESVSLELLEGIQDILFSLGITSAIKIAKKENNDAVVCGKKCHTKESYNLTMSINSAKIFCDMINVNCEFEYKSNCQEKFMYISKNLNKIFFKISSVENYLYSGNVYNFETEDESHSFSTKYISTHNCDASRGDADDRTAIEIIDMDGIDENGNPIIEQVAEYNGKRTGDEIGEILYQYGTAYNNALIVVDCIGGTGDAAILTLMRMGYNNIYYDDPTLKSYTVQRKYIEYNISPEDRLPGFHSGQVRFQMLTNFASLVKNNGFKIRSSRVISELDTWIFKGESGRIDHADGKHDDTLTCLAMGLFVMQYSFQKMESTKSKDKAILNAWVANTGVKTVSSPTMQSKSTLMTPKKSMVLPFYNEKSLKKEISTPKSKALATNIWLFGAVMR